MVHARRARRARAWAAASRPARARRTSMAAAKRSTTCWVSETAPSRSSSDKSILYDIEATLVGRTLPLQGHTHNGCTTQEVNTDAERHGAPLRLQPMQSALARLAALDSASPPRGPALIAEADSRMLAALPLGSGRADRGPVRADRRARRAARAAPDADRGGRQRRRGSPPRAPRAPARPPLARLTANVAARTPAAHPRGSNPQPPPANGAGPPSGRRRFAMPTLRTGLRAWGLRRTTRASRP